MTCILIIDSEHSGAYNMAFDGYFLENTIQFPILRFYNWNPPAVSIGYHQKIKNYDEKKFQDLGIDIVRRPTGGRAVLHNNEITYSVIIPESSEYFKLNIHELYYKISKAINAGLNDAGIETEIERNRHNGMKGIRSQLKCFDSTARFEIKNNGSLGQFIPDLLVPQFADAAARIVDEMRVTVNLAGLVDELTDIPHGADLCLAKQALAPLELFDAQAALRRVADLAQEG